MPLDIYKPKRVDRRYSLGWIAIDFIEQSMVHSSGDVTGMPVELTDDQCAFLLDCYSLEAPGTENEGRRLIDTALDLKPKGSSKSEMAAFTLIFDAMGPSRFAGWAEGGEVWTDPWGIGISHTYEPGEPMGRPIKNPFVRCLATAEDQAANTYDNIYFLFREGPLKAALRHPDDAGLGRILLPDGGRIEPSSSAGGSKDGGLESCANADEALALDTPLPTPGGWTTMGEVQAGDLLLGATGDPVVVVKATDVMEDRDCYRVETASGTSIVASGGHLWEVGISGSSETSVRTTEELACSELLWTVRTANGDRTEISSITPVDSVPVKCVGVDAEDHLFLAGDKPIVTRNTHLWIQKGHRDLYHTVNRNLRKRKAEAEPFMLCTSTYFTPGESSICEETLQSVLDYKNGKLKREPRILVHHRWGDLAEDELNDEDRIHEALKDAYANCPWMWPAIPAIIDDLALARKGSIPELFRYYLNCSSTATNAWLARYEWQRCGPDAVDDDGNPLPLRPIAKGDVITIGFDGSRRRKKGITDSTVIAGCRVSDGAVFIIGAWEQPHGFVDPTGEGWEVPVGEVDAAMRKAFQDFRVVGCYCDPALWQGTVADWTAKYGHKMIAKATASNPMEFWMIGGNNKRTVDALEKFEDAVLNLELRHFDEPILTSHVLNARLKESNVGYQIGKETPYSPHKIDAAVAAVLAWRARLDAVAKGVGLKRGSRKAVRIR